MEFKLDKRKVITFAFKLFLVGMVVGAYVAYSK